MKMDCHASLAMTFQYMRHCEGSSTFLCRDMREIHVIFHKMEYLTLKMYFRNVQEKSGDACMRQADESFYAQPEKPFLNPQLRPPVAEGVPGHVQQPGGL
jgi:hypothetical protein